MNGENLYSLIHKLTGIEQKQFRLTHGYREIYPTNQMYYWKQEDTIMIKLRILGGG